MTPTIIPNPQAADGRPVRVPLGTSDFDVSAVISPTRTLSIAQISRLVGVNFDGSTLDTNFWTAATANGGVLSQGGGQVTLTASGASSSASLSSVRKGRHLAGLNNSVRMVVRIPGVGSSGNTRRWGTYTTTDGVFFQVVGNTFSIGVRYNSADTIVSSGSFLNQFGQPNYVLDTNAHTYEIFYISSSAWFFIDNKLIHKVSAPTRPLCQTLTLPIKIENFNSASDGSTNALECRVANIKRFGRETARPRSYYTASAETVLLKRAAGTLHSVVVGTKGTGNATITLYDNTAASGTPLFLLDGVNSLGTVILDIDFFVGLTMVTGSGIGSITILYD